MSTVQVAGRRPPGAKVSATARISNFRFLGRALSPIDQGPGSIEALRRDIASGALRWEAIVEVASHHLVTPALFSALAEKGLLADLPADVHDYLRAVHELNGERNRRIAEQTRAVVGALDQAGLEPVLLKGTAHLLGGVYGDPAVRVITDIDLLVARERLGDAVRSLAAIGYHEAGIEHFPGEDCPHHEPLVRADAIARVELHTDLVETRYAALLPAGQVLRDARRSGPDGRGARLPSWQDLIVHNVAHAQLSDRGYASGQVSLRQLIDLVRLGIAGGRAVDWRELRERFDRAGYGRACEAYLLLAARFLGQVPPPGGRRRPSIAARLACWRLASQNRHPWFRAADGLLDYHRHLLAELCIGRPERRRVSRLLHLDGYRNYLRSVSGYLRQAP